MIKLVEVTQIVTFDLNKNINTQKVMVPWSTVVIIAVLGPLVVSGFRRTIAPVTNLYSVPEKVAQEYDI